MNFISVCSGIEAASVAWAPLGWEAVAFSEIEPFPRAVLAHHYPHVPNLGDMTKHEDWSDDIAADLLCGGTPCQSYSLAGLRKGLDDPRGDLMLTYGAIAAKRRPRWLVWENVPGVLSSNGGRDFGTLLGLLGHIGYGFAYRVLDAQFFGVPQRRRRVFVVGCLGDWRAAAAVLFERHSLQGHPAPRREAGQKPAGTLTRSALDGSGACGGDGRDGFLIPDVGRALTTSNQRIDAETETFIVSQTLAGGARQRGGYSHDDVPMVAHSLRGEGFDASEDGTPLVPVAHVEVMPTMLTGANTPAGHNARSGHSKDAYIVPVGMQVRRLTPRECERLQGFPDDYTLIPHRGKPAADGPRYKALGNSWAVPCARWIGDRIAAVDALRPALEVAA